MGGKGQLGHRAVRDEPAGSVLAVSSPAHRQLSADSGPSVGDLVVELASGELAHSTHHLTLLTQALAACGHYGEGLAALREAVALVEDTGQRYVEAEIHRLEGNLLLAEKGSAEAEACYVRALEVARAQEARSLETPCHFSADEPMTWFVMDGNKIVSNWDPGTVPGSQHQSFKISVTAPAYRQARSRSSG
jgi:tetratricopeptide (TPR) repeat protein